MNIASVFDLIARLTKGRSSDQIVDDAMYPSGSSSGITNRKTGYGFHARDDGSVEAAAGSSGLLVDGKDNAVLLSGNSVVLGSNKKVVLRAPPDGIVINGGAINPAYYPTEQELLVGQVASELLGLVQARSPVVLTNSAKIGPLVSQIMGYTTEDVLTGNPVPHLIPIDKLFTPLPIFKPVGYKDAMLNTMSSILQRLF